MTTIGSLDSAVGPLYIYRWVLIMAKSKRNGSERLSFGRKTPRTREKAPPRSILRAMYEKEGGDVTLTKKADYKEENIVVHKMDLLFGPYGPQAGLSCSFRNDGIGRPSKR